MSKAPPPFIEAKSPVEGVKSEPKVVRFDLSARAVVIVVVAIGVVWMLIHLLPALLVLVTALMLVGALDPFVAWLEKRKVRRGMAIGIVFTAVVAVTLGVIVLIIPSMASQIKTLAENEPAIREQVSDYLGRSHVTAPLAASIRDLHYTELLASSKATLLTLTTRVFEVISLSVAAIFLALYTMLDRDRLRGALFAVVPRSHHVRLSRIILNLGTIVGGYIRGQVITCALMMTFILILLLICRVPNALAIAGFGAVMDLLPYIGIVLTMVPAVLAAFAKGPAVAAAVFIFLFIYEEFEGRVLIPWVYGKALRLPSSVVFFSLIAGYALAGVVGSLLALPIAAAALMLIDEMRVELPGETMQPEDIAQMRKDHRTEREYEQRAQNMPVEEAAAVAVEIAKEGKIPEAEAMSEKENKTSRRSAQRE